MPFFGCNDDVIVDRIKSGSFPMYHTFSRFVSSLSLSSLEPLRWRNPLEQNRELRDLLEKILQPDPTLRYSIAQLKEHPWFSCKVNFNGITRVRSRSFGYGQVPPAAVPALNLNEPTFNKLKPDEKIFVTPRGIVSHRQYLIELAAQQSLTSSNEGYSHSNDSIGSSPSPPTSPGRDRRGSNNYTANGGREYQSGSGLSSFASPPSSPTNEAKKTYSDSQPVQQVSPTINKKRRNSKLYSLFKFIGTKNSPKKIEHENQKPATERSYLPENKASFDSPYI